MTGDREQALAAAARAHPLYRRMTGQAVWLFFEERDIPPALAQAFVDRYWDRRERVLAELARCLGLLGETPSGFTLERVRTGPGPICPVCRDLAGKAFALEPGFQRFFPPFSISCRIEARPVEAGEDARFSPLPALAPPPRLYCDDEWLFQP